MAQVKIFKDGSVEVSSGWQDIGGGARTILAILASRVFGFLPVDKIRTRIGHSTYPGSGTSAGSSTTNALIGEVNGAAWKALRDLLQLVSTKLNVPADQLEVVLGRVQQRGNPSVGMTWEDACALINDTLIGYEPSSFDYSKPVYAEFPTDAWVSG